MNQSEVDYDRTAPLLDAVQALWRSAGIEDEHAFLAVADFLTFGVLRKGIINNSSEKALKDIFQRMSDCLDDWRKGERP